MVRAPIVLLIASLLLGPPRAAADEPGSEPMTVQGLRAQGRAALIALATEQLRASSPDSMHAHSVAPDDIEQEVFELIQ